MRIHWKKIGIVAGIVLVLIQFPEINPVPIEYEVMTVENGYVTVQNVYTKQIVNIHDDSLVQQALNGTIKEGTIIKR